MDTESVPTSPQEFFSESPTGLTIFLVIEKLISALGPSERKISKSQIVFRHHHGFAYVWRPAQYLKSNIPVVLSIALHRKLNSPRFKEITQVGSTIWMHHLELKQPTQVDLQVLRWLKEAYSPAA